MQTNIINKTLADKLGIGRGLLTLALLSLAATSPCRALPIVAGNDLLFDSTGKVTLIINDPFFPGGFTETINLIQTAPPATIHRDAQVGNIIDTEIVSLQLSGVSINVGPVTARVGTGQGVIEGGSFGQITNVVQNPGDPGFPTGNPSSFQSGISSFDVLFEIDFSGGTLYNKIEHTFNPVPIFELPPEPLNYTSPGSYPLWMDVGVLGNHNDDIIVGLVGPVMHTPEPSTILLLGLGVLGLANRRQVRRRPSNAV